MRRRYCTVLGIFTVLVLAGAVDLSGSVLPPLTLWRPVALRLGLDLGGGTRILLAAPTAGRTVNDSTMAATARVVADRIERGMGVPGATVQVVSGARHRAIAVELPGLDAATLQRVEALLRTPGCLALVRNGATLLRQQQSIKGFPVLATGADVQPSSVAVGTDSNG